MSLLGDLIKAYGIAEESLRKLERHRLETMDAAFRETIPELEAFDNAVKAGSSSDIAQQSGKIAEHLDSLVRELKQDNIDPGFFPELAKQLRRASTWDYYPIVKDEYQQLSPTIVGTLKRLHKQVKDKLSGQP